MAKTKFYKVHTLPSNKTQFNTGVFGKLTKGRRRRQLVASVIGVYILVGGLVGWVLFNNSSNSAKASESALVSASLKLSEEKQYRLGDNIKIGMTLQNTSVSESLNNISITLFSTKDSIKWSTIKSPSITSGVTTITPEGLIQLPLLSSGERIEYEINGSVQANDLEYTNIQGKLKYLNKEGLQDGDTNRIRLNTKSTSDKTLVDFKSNKPVYAPGEEIVFDLETKANLEQPGKVYITNKDTGEVVSSFDCDLTNSLVCENKVKNLGIGDYSALLINGDNDIFSNTLAFSVNGKKSDFIPNSQSSIEFPAGNTSINGILNLVAKKVISFNQTPNADTLCTFEIYSADKLINSVKIPVENDRSCKASLNSDIFKNGNGVYQIKLANTNIQKDVAFVAKSANLVNLENKSTVLEKGKPVELSASAILDQTAQPLNDKKVTLGILHTATSEYTEITSINGEQLKLVNGNFSAIVPPSYLSKGGFYLVYIRIEDGQQSDWVALDFEDKQIALSGSGVLYDTSSLRIGQNTNFSLENLIDRNGNQVDEGDCSANIYVTGVAAPVNIKGQIKKGICNSTLPAGKITKAGPALITFTSPELQNKINQSKQINFEPGIPEKYGKVTFESPVKASFANNLIIGPVTDRYGNLVDALNYKLILADTVETIQEIPVTITNGFAQIQVASTYLKDDKIIVKLKNDKDIEVLNTSFDIDKTNSKYISADLPSEVSSDKNIQASIAGLELPNQNECKLVLTKSQDEVSEFPSTYDNTTGKCAFDWNLNKNRSSSQALLQLVIGDQTYSKIVNFKNSDASNLFVITPQIRTTVEDELAISLLTSPIVDIQGLPITSGSLKWQYNGKVEQTEIDNGLAKLSLPAKKLETKDIQVTTTERNLELDLDVKAGITSISKTNNLNIYIGNYDINNSDSIFQNIISSNLITEGQSRIFEFKTDVCSGKLINPILGTTELKTHLQAGSCYVLAEGKAGENTISFEKAGFVLGSFTYNTTTEQQDVNWCETNSTSEKCMIQVLAPLNSKVDAVIKDGDKEYKFSSNELENTVIVSQNGLNPLKKYPVEVRYKDSKNMDIVQTTEIIGEKLSK